MDTTAEHFYGFTDCLSPMRRAKVEQSIRETKKKKTVYRRVKYGDALYSYTEYCRALVKDGHQFVEVMNGDKTEYRAVDVRGFYATLNKSRFDFCKYLRSCGFDDDAKAQAWIDAETQAKAELEKLREEQRVEKGKTLEHHMAMSRALDERIAAMLPEIEKSCFCAVAAVKKFCEKKSIPYQSRLLTIIALIQHPEIAEENDFSRQW